MSEELALEQRVGERPAVLGDEAALLARARVVDGATDEILAGTGLARDEDSGRGLGHLLHYFKDTRHGGTRADDLVEGVAAFDLAPKIEVLLAQPLVGFRQRRSELDVFAGQSVGLEGASDIEAQLLRIPGFGDIAVDAPLVHCAHDRRDVGVAGQHHANRSGLAFDRFLEELDAGHAGEHLIGDHQGDLFPIEDLQALLAGLGGEDAVLVGQSLGQARADRFFVVDDQDGVGIGTGSDAVRLGGQRGNSRRRIVRGLVGHARNHNCRPTRVRTKAGAS